MTTRAVPYWATTAVVSPGGFLLMAVYAVPSMFLSNPDLAGDAGVRIGISVTALLLLFAMLWLARATWLKSAGTSFHPVRVVGTFVGFSAIRAVAVAFMFEATGVTDGIDWSQRLPASIIGFSTALLVVNAVVGSVTEHRRREQLLASEQQAARRARDLVLTRIDEDWQATAERIRTEMLARVATVSASDPGRAAQSLRDTAEQVVRPVSRDLAGKVRPVELTAEAEVDRGLHFGGLIRSATSGAPLSPVWTAVLVMAFGGPYVLSVLPVGKALYVLAVGFVLVWLALYVGNAVLVRVLPGRGIAGRVVWVLVVLLLAAVVVAASTPLVVGGPPEAVRHIMVGDLFLILEMGLAIVIARAAALQQESVLGQVQEARDLAQWQLTRARCLQWNEQRALARAMHGPAQSAVTSAVLRLEAAGSRGGVDEALVSAVRTDIVSALDTLGREAPAATRLESALTQVAQTWTGVCEVTWSVPEEVRERLSADPLGSATVTELVSEGCWNAIRHAVASVVDVALEIAGPRAIRLTVRNDGPAPQTGEPGLGSRMFTDMTLSWDLAREGDTTVLTALVPVA